jgi:hypothetical protein
MSRDNDGDDRATAWNPADGVRAWLQDTPMAFRGDGATV